MLSRLIGKIDSTTISFAGWFSGFFGVLFIRFFLENLSSPTPSFPAVPDILTLVHYSLFYFGVVLSLALIIRAFVPDVEKITKFLLFGLPIIWLPPIFDLIVSGGRGYQMAYVFAVGADLFRALFTIGGIQPVGGITPGIKLEVILVLIAVFSYVAAKAKKFSQAFFAALFSYLGLFFWLAFPSIIFAIQLFFRESLPLNPSSALVFDFAHAASIQNFFRPIIQPTYAYGFETVFNLGISWMYLFIDFFLCLGWLFVYRKSAARALINRMRIGRFAHYVLMGIIGFFSAGLLAFHNAFHNWADYLGVGVLLLTYFCAWLFAVSVNDLADVKIDRISNPHQPIVAGASSIGEVKTAACFFFAWALLGGYLAGYWTFFTVATFMSAYYIYSAPPMRLKRVPLLSTFLIAIACLSAAMGGFYFASPSRFISSFPEQLLLIILFCVTLGANFKDIKDEAGDRADNIATIPALFGPKIGNAIVGGMLAVAFLIVPIILRAPSLLLPSLVAAIVGYFLVVIEPYREWRVFALYFLYAGVVMAMLFLHL